jgi:pimeloyl-ACP methyl ester carboxylesterase
MIPATQPAGPPVAQKSSPPARVWLIRVVAVLISVPLLLAAIGAGYQAVATAAAERAYPPPGLLVDAGGYRLHLYCKGQGSPTVILDAANQGTVSNWVWIQSGLSGMTRVCAYDRAGEGWSDSAPQALDTRQNAQALHTLLANAGITPPYVLVGHSFGGLYTRTYADSYPSDVAGLVFIEGTHPDVLRAQGLPDVMPNAPSQGMIDAAPAVSRLGLLRLMKFPQTDPDLPERQRNELAARLASPAWADQIKRQYHLFPTLLAQVRPLYAAGSLGDRPVAVVLGSHGDGGVEALQALFRQQAILSSRGKIYTVDGASHISLVDREAHATQTAAAIADIVTAVRGQ